jgi:hypothetical protein
VSIILPDFVVRGIVEQQQREWGPRLEALDPGLRLIPPFQNPPLPDMVPNRWHLARFSEIRGHEVYITIQGPAGEFREMDEAMFDALKRLDMHSNRSRKAAERAARTREAAIARAKERTAEDRRTELAERIKHHESPSIHIPRSV